MIIGVDFDNTIAGYDELFCELAADAGVIEPGVVATKQSIRDLVRATPNGETMWRRLQASAYGERMQEAKLIDGVTDFFRAANEREIPLRIISHKTERAVAGNNGVNLCDAAMDWMVAQQFFNDETLGLSPSAVFFEISRKAKISRIAMLGCTHFIDDLVETFADPSFPNGIEKILFADKAPAGVRRYSNWMDIQNELIGESS